MKWLKNLLARLYATYALLLFICTMLIMLLPMWLVSLLPSPRNIRYFMALGRAWMHVYMPLIFCPVRRKGVEYFRSKDPYIIVCNHNSMMDIHTTTYAIPAGSKSLGKKELEKAPIFGIMYKVGTVLVDRTDPESRKRTLPEMKKVLQEGIHMLLYPEGTRNKTDQPLKSFYDGAFILAVETGRPILPAVIFNTRKILPPGKFFYALPHAIDIHFLPPIYPEGNSEEDMQLLKERVFKTMWEHIEQH
ncbi:lysophospholipid acyltransferase family protein [Chitinophaga ginsengisoli]|uniref:1-acyl-sn-glycerol-3-phosphate acyltransferase n=1 Tax=Chitinophaga ginsengisoli TaxID=363837 RepID=A0A2P8GDW0_9BACT|nr:1-acyl-sn-glycerol-3-phosphate acyltransferase [Chitinophaga ginsengisoli]PSL32174.1 1-acyl-sn-glycerol-3-phosphate acyltransferase [Chitinophaga ginsengisoli]